MSINLDPAIEAMAKELAQAGYRFEAEVLTSDEVCFEVIRDVPDADIGDSVAVDVCPNGPEVPLVVTQLIKDAYERIRTVPREDQEPPNSDRQNPS